MLEQADILATPILYTDNGTPTGCGVSFIALQKAQGRKDLVGLSLSWYGGPSVSGKFIYSESLPSTPKVNFLPLRSAWFRVTGSSTPTQLAKLAQDDGSLLVGYDFAHASRITLEAVQGATIQIGYTLLGDETEKIMYGKATMQASDFVQYTECMNEFIAKTRNRLPHSKK